MRISYICIENFRNFKKCEVYLGQNVILVGENKAGKSNLITALRLVLDPNYNRNLGPHDFWDGEGEPFDGRIIRIVIQFSDFINDTSKNFYLAQLSSCLVTTDPKNPVAQLVYEYAPESTSIDKAQIFSEENYQWHIYRGNESGERFNPKHIWKEMPIFFIEAIRDIDHDTRSWSRSPLRELIRTIESVDNSSIQPYSDEILASGNRMVEDLLTELQTNIQNQLRRMIGSLHSINPRLGVDSSNPDSLLRSLRIYVDGIQNRPITRTSLGLQNAVYLSLLSLQLDQKRIKNLDGDYRPYMPITVLEEPEVHLHPHLQRLVFYHFLLSAKNREVPVIISTHSPDLVTTANITDLVLIKNTLDQGSQAYSTTELFPTLSDRDKNDLERFLDITKAEMLFSKGTLFVEGDVEVLLVSTLMDVLGISLDSLGISIINVYGVNFYHVALLATKLNIPFAILTDGDKYTESNGLLRGISITKAFDDEIAKRLQKLYDDGNLKNVRNQLKKYGIFVNDWTLEPELLKCGFHKEFKSTFIDLGKEIGVDVIAGPKHIDRYLIEQTDESIKPILKSIDDTRWRKGRFAHRLSNYILEKSQTIEEDADRQNIVPLYIREAVKFLKARITLAE